MKWIEVESQISNHQVRTYRGQADDNKIEELLSGKDSGFLKLENSYWLNDQDDEDNENKTKGTFERLGYKQYSNFTGTLYMRYSTIIIFKRGL